MPTLCVVSCPGHRDWQCCNQCEIFGAEIWHCTCSLVCILLQAHTCCHLLWPWWALAFKGMCGDVLMLCYNDGWRFRPSCSCNIIFLRLSASVQTMAWIWVHPKAAGSWSAHQLGKWWPPSVQWIMQCGKALARDVQWLPMTRLESLPNSTCTCSKSSQQMHMVRTKTCC